MLQTVFDLHAFLLLFPGLQKRSKPGLTDGQQYNESSTLIRANI